MSGGAGSFLLNWVANLPVFAVPLLLACLGQIVTARSGMLNLGSEGMMAVGALAAVMIQLAGLSAYLGLASAVLAGIALAAVFGLATIAFRADQVLCGLIAVALGLGITGTIGKDFAHKPVAGFDKLQLSALSEIPWIGPILFRQDILVYVCVLITIFVWWVINRTITGLRLRAVGEDPSAADTAGVNVAKYRMGAVLAGGALTGLAGGYLSLAAGHVWVEHMTAGRGWIAIALAIFARWRVGPAVFGALLFGATEAIIPRLQASGIDAPVYLLLMLPYLLTIAALFIPAALKIRMRDDTPSALMRNYVREDR